MSETDHRRLTELIPACIVALGVASLVFDVGSTLYLLGPGGILTASGILGRVIGLPFFAAVVYLGWWLHRSDLDVQRYPRVALWTVGFTVTFLAINLLIIGFAPMDSFYANLVWANFSGYAGATGGLVVGVAEARAIDRAVEAERTAVHAEHADAQRKWLDYLNSLLRHEVLNNASIIQGYASLLLEDEDLPEDVRADLRTIHHQSRDMTDVVQDVRILIQATDQYEAFDPVDVVGVLEAEIEDLRATYRDVSVDLTAEDGTEAAYVLADGLLPRVFSNLLTNAVEHNAGESATVSVAVETTPEQVRVRVGDDGPGVPESERERLFERSQEDHGLGLYLVSVLVNRYDGSVELTETGPEGTIFTVELPRVDPPADAAASATPAEPPTSTGSTG